MDICKRGGRKGGKRERERSGGVMTFCGCGRSGLLGRFSDTMVYKDFRSIQYANKVTKGQSHTAQGQSTGATLMRQR